MPKGLVKTGHDEHDWSKAKSIVHKEYGLSEGSDKFYKLVNHIYMGMHDRKPGHTNVTRKSELWLKTLSKADHDTDMKQGGSSSGIKQLHVKHRDSMRRKVGAISKVAEHHGYKPGLPKEGRKNSHEMEGSSAKAPKHTFEEHSQTYHHPKTGARLTVRAQKPYNYDKPGQSDAKTKRHGVEWQHEHGGRFRNDSGDKPKWLGHVQKPIHHLDQHLSETNNTEPYSRKLRRSLSKSACSTCQGTGIIRITYKSLDNEEKSLRICPICKPF